MNLFAAKCILYLILAFKAESISNFMQIQRKIGQVIFASYDKDVRPVKDPNTAVSVRLNPSLFSFVEVNVTQQTLTFKQWLKMYWIDEYLTWNPADYNNVMEISVQRSTVWQPDIMILEQVEIGQLTNDEQIVTVRHDGYITTSVDQLVTVKCQFDVIDFPYDTQNCTLRYTSWMYDEGKISLYPTEPVDLSVYSKNDEWRLKNITSRISHSTADGSSYVDVYYYIVITRMPTYYIVTFIWPSFLITCLSIVGVFSPFDEAGMRQEKVTMGLTSLLSMAVILQIVTDQMPRTSNGMPLLAIYIMFEIFLGAAATLFTVFVIYLHSFWMSNTAVPASLLASTCMRKRKRKISTSTMQTDLSATNLSAPYRKEPKLKICYGDGYEEALDFNINFKDLRMTSVRLRHRWSTSTHRLDLILMSIFIAINCVATGIILAVGNEKLNA